MLGFGLFAAAAAQAEPGDGVRLGEYDIRPSVAVEGGYQTNVFLLSRTGALDAPNDWILRITPQIAVERAGGRAKLSVFALYDWRKYAYNPELDARDNFEVGASTSVNEDRVLGVQLEERFRIQSRPAELELLGNYRRSSNTARVSTAYRPGGALEVRPQGYWHWDRFSAERRSYAERHTTGAIVDARWAFLARTVVAANAEVGEVRYVDTIDLPSAPGTGVNSGSIFWRVESGIVGQVSPKVSVAIKGGFGQAHYRRGEDLNDARGVLATIKGEWTPRVTNVLAAGYERTFSDVFFTNFDVVDRVFVRYRHLLAGEWLASASAIAERQEYSQPFARKDVVARFEPSVRRVIRKWADVGVSYSWEQRWSKEGAPTPGAVPGADAPNDYVTHRLILTANFQL